MYVLDVSDMEEAKSWSREYGAALLCATTLHAFGHDLIDASELREAAQRNHAIIVLCEEGEFAGPLLFGSVPSGLSTPNIELGQILR